MGRRKRTLGEAEAEEEAIEGLKFKWKLKKLEDYRECAFRVTGTILLPVAAELQEVGSVEATLVDRAFIREGLKRHPDTFPNFHDVCYEAGEEVHRAAKFLCDSAGRVTYRPLLAQHGWDGSANEGGFLHVYMVTVAAAHRGKAIGLRALRHLMWTRLKARWTLATIQPSAENVLSRSEQLEMFHMSCRDPDELPAEFIDQQRERDARVDAASNAVSRYFARLGFSQAGPANGGTEWWYIVKAKARERSRSAAAALPVAVMPNAPQLSDADRNMKKVVGIGSCRNDRANIEAAMRDPGLDLAKAVPLHHCIAEGNHVTTRIPMLVSMGCDVNGRDHLGYAPIHMAGSFLQRVDHMPEAICALLDAGADAKVPCPEGYLAAEMAEKQWVSRDNYLYGLKKRHCTEPTSYETTTRRILEQTLTYLALVRLRAASGLGQAPPQCTPWFFSTLQRCAEDMDSSSGSKEDATAHAAAIKRMIERAFDVPDLLLDATFRMMWQEISQLRDKFVAFCNGYWAAIFQAQKAAADAANGRV